MTWNHRVVRSLVAGEPFFEIREVYYTESGEVCSMTAEGVSPCGDSVEELFEEIERFIRARERPVIEEMT